MVVYSLLFSAHSLFRSGSFLSWRTALAPTAVLLPLATERAFCPPSGVAAATVTATISSFVSSSSSSVCSCMTTPSKSTAKPASPSTPSAPPSAQTRSKRLVGGPPRLGLLDCRLLEHFDLALRDLLRETLARPEFEARSLEQGRAR